MGDFAWIIHAASIASPIYYRKDPIGTMDGNINGLRNLLDYFHKRKLEGKDALGFLFFSSSEIYGDPRPANIPTREDYRGLVSCTGPRACYDEAKRYGETLCVNFFRQHGLPTRCARPFNNYGPGLKITDGRVLPDFCRDVLAGRDNRHAQRRLGDAHLLLQQRQRHRLHQDAGQGSRRRGVQHRHRGPRDQHARSRRQGRVAGARTVRLRRRGDHASEQGQGLSDRQPQPPLPDHRKARAHLGYEPKVSLEDGLRRTLLWYSGNREAEEK